MKSSPVLMDAEKPYIRSVRVLEITAERVNQPEEAL